MKEKRVRVRYAPSPTGDLHIGGARTALFNYLFAKKNNGDFIIRIEDTDIDRNIKDGINSQLENLDWLKIISDETVGKENKKYGPYNQMARLDKYETYLETLLKQGHAYKCYCTKEELEEERNQQRKAGKFSYRYSRKCLTNPVPRKDYSIRLKLPNSKEYKWNDIVRKEVSINTDDIGDFIIYKSNKIPTYNFACVIDDILMDITHVFRGEEHISNTPKQLVLYDLLKVSPPTFCHLTLITNLEGKKLSKRDQSITQFIEQYREKGYIPEAMFNFLVLLGWSPVGEREIYDIDTFIKMFDVERFSKSPSKFDENKLKWISNRYIKALSDDDYIKLVTPFLKANFNDESKFSEVALLFKNQISYGEEIIELSKVFFENLELSDHTKKSMNEINGTEIKGALFRRINLINDEDWNENSIAKVIGEIKNDFKREGTKLFMPIRILTTKQIHGPDLKKIIIILGKERVLKNIGEYK